METFAKLAAKARLQKFAEKAASDYLGKDSELNSSIQKIARDESLNTEEVARVCEMANHSVYASLFNKLAEKTFTFPIADAKQIITAINKEAGAISTPASNYIAVDVVDNEPRTKLGSLDEPKLNASVEHLGTVKHRASVFLDKLAAIHQNFKTEITRAEMVKESACMDFMHDTKQMILTGKATFHDIYDNLVAVRPERVNDIAVLLKTAALQLGRTFEITELAKVAGVAVDKNLIRTGLSFSGRPLKVINGGQALIMSLDTLVEQDAELSLLRRGLTITGDKVKMVKKEIQNQLAKELNVGL